MTASLVSGRAPRSGNGTFSGAFSASRSLPPGRATSCRRGTDPSAVWIDSFTAAWAPGEAAAGPRSAAGVASSMSRVVFARRSAKRSGVRYAATPSATVPVGSMTTTCPSTFGGALVM